MLARIFRTQKWEKRRYNLYRIKFGHYNRTWIVIMIRGAVKLNQVSLPKIVWPESISNFHEKYRTTWSASQFKMLKRTLFRLFTFDRTCSIPLYIKIVQTWIAGTIEYNKKWFLPKINCLESRHVTAVEIRAAAAALFISDLSACLRGFIVYVVFRF